jgi:glycosyltransferase involved in cell wall biosynthesis
LHTLRRQHPDFIFTGIKRGEELARHYACGDLFLFPSRSETFGNVVTEAMASGLAVVAYDQAAAGEHIRDNETGALPAEDTTEGFIGRATALAYDREHMRRIGEAAARHAAGLGWSGIVARFTDLLQQQIEARRHAPAA